VSEVAVADLDGDGHLDLIAANVFTGIEVRLGDGSGAFGGPVVHDLGTAESYFANQLELVDLDDDGALDVVTSGLGFDAPGEPGVRRRDAGRRGRRVRPVRAAPGGLAAQVEIPVPEEVHETALADVDGDDHLDVVVTRWNKSSALVLFGEGDGSFSETHKVASGGRNAGAVEVGDLDGDGRSDLAISHSGSDGYTGSLGVVLNRLRSRQH
jgi:hypothetical protein